MKMNRGLRLTGKTLRHIPLVIFCAFFLFPFIIMITTSFKTMQECLKIPIRVLPERLNFSAYVTMNDYIPFVRYFRNTVIITGFSILGVVLSCPLVAYSLGRIRWRGRNALFIMTLAVMMIPYAVTMVPVYMVYARLRMIGTWLPLIVPTYFGVPFFIFLLRQFFMGLPKDLDESARIDGSNEFNTYVRVMLPLCKPAVLTIAIFQLLGSWNDFTGPLIYLQRSSMYTLQIGLQQFKTAHTTAWPEMMAASTLICLPVIILFFFMQKSFMEGITFTGIKA
jgi:multiple sugar transport system permease protein